MALRCELRSLTRFLRNVSKITQTKIDSKINLIDVLRQFRSFWRWNKRKIKKLHKRVSYEITFEAFQNGRLFSIRFCKSCEYLLKYALKKIANIESHCPSASLHYVTSQEQQVAVEISTLSKEVISTNSSTTKKVCSCANTCAFKKLKYVAHKVIKNSSVATHFWQVVNELCVLCLLSFRLFFLRSVDPRTSTRLKVRNSLPDTILDYNFKKPW